MRNLKYILASGNVVSTYSDALQSGESYKMICEPIYETIEVNPNTRRKRVTRLVARAEH